MTGTTDERKRAMLKSAMGSAIAEALGDPVVIEIMVNPDGALRLDRLGEGRIDTGVRFETAQVERIIRLVAAHVRTEVHAGSPIVSGELPPHDGLAGERFEGLLPPVSLAPCFAIRKPAARIFTLADYVERAIMPAAIARLLSQAVVDRHNILIAGGTSSGKTTLANALLAEMADLDERILLIEDTRELQCAASDRVALRTQGALGAIGQAVSRSAIDTACPIASSSARFAAARRSTCSRRGTRAIPAESRRCMPIRLRARSTGSNSLSKRRLPPCLGG
jgi:type IV secretion system protein VirB11